MTFLRIVVIDDHALFRRGLIGLLSEFDGFEVVGDAGSGAEALTLVPQLKPDVVLLDINMPGMDGIDTLKALQKYDPGLPVLMLTVSQADEDLLGAIAAGATGYLLKNTEPETLERTLRDVALGKSVLAPEMTSKLFQVLRRRPSDTADSLLSEREVQVLRCLARGLTTTQVAVELFISENTVKTHTRHILEKLSVSNRVEAVARAIESGML